MTIVLSSITISVNIRFRIFYEYNYNYLNKKNNCVFVIKFSELYFNM